MVVRAPLWTNSFDLAFRRTDAAIPFPCGTIAVMFWLIQFVAIGQTPSVPPPPPVAAAPTAVGTPTMEVAAPLAPPTPENQVQDTLPADKPAIPKIASEPKFIDRGQFLPEPLSKLASVDLRNRSLQEMLDWIRQETKLTVLVDQSELQKTSILLTDPYSDWLDQAPIYYLLDRLRQLNLGWYCEAGVVYITSREKSAARQTSVAYHLSELLDKGYTSDTLLDTIPMIVVPSKWHDNGGEGRIDLIGDMLFIRNTVDIQIEIQGLLKALLTPAEQTYISDSAANAQLRDRLEANVDTEFRDLPLTDIFSQLGTRAVVDLRLARDVLNSRNIRSRELISLSMGERSLRIVLQFLLAQRQMSAEIRDGVLWIGRQTDEPLEFSTAIYDVRDLCRDDYESDGLKDAIQSQMPDIWTDDTGDSELVFFQSGTMVVWTTAEAHAELLSLLRRYRTALLNSKPRPVVVAERNEVLTRYYRLHAGLAVELEHWIPQRIEPESWLNSKAPQAIGTIELVESIPETTLVSAAKGSEGSSNNAAVTFPFKTLIIRQHESVHVLISETIRRIEKGDGHLGGAFGGGGFGGGGFGSGGNGGGFGGAGLGGAGGGTHGMGFGGGYFRVSDRQ